jgi:beta-alanine--pyruvate transaminase
LPQALTLARSTDRPGLRGARALDAAFFDEDLVLRVVGDTIVLAPALIASEADIGDMVDRASHLLRALR